jgi:hypothetical protein
MDQVRPSIVEIAPGAAFADTPGWVDLQPYQIPQTANPKFIHGGVSSLLDDVQIDLCGGERGWYHRHAALITALVGAERAAQVQIVYDPQFERVEVHTVRVLRGEQSVDHVRISGFETLRREQNMERLMFDGHQTIVYTIPDVRVGDVVEVAFTTYGMRKSVSNRHSTWLGFERPGIVESRVRQRAPRHRIIEERSINDPPQATETVDGDVVDRRWRTFERPQVKGEQLTPPWVLQGASIQFSEWKNWNEIADAFTPLYEETEALPAIAEQEIAAIAAAQKSPSDRAAALLRFVQSGVRYLAIAIGEGGYTLVRSTKCYLRAMATAKTKRSCTWRWRAGSTLMRVLLS